MSTAPPLAGPPRPIVQAFLRDSKDHPDDEVPRHILADWLDDYGDEHDRARAELIRVQCPLARVWSSRLQRREAQLTRRHTAAWLGPLRPFVEAVRFDRGLARLTVEARQVGAELGGLTGTEAYAWVDGLAVLQLGDGGVDALVDGPFLDDVQSLTAQESNLGNAGVGALAGSPRVWGLTELHLAFNCLTDGAAQSLAASPHLAALRVLGLRRNGSGGPGLHDLGHSPTLPALTHLSLAFNQLDDQALWALVDSPLMGRLRELDLRSNHLGDPGAAALAGSGAGALRALDL